MPASTASAGVVSGTAAADDRSRRVLRRQAGERAGQLLAARADDAGDAEDLAGMQREARRRGRRPRDRARRLDQHDVAAKGRLQRLAVVFGLQAAADHQLVQVRHVRPRRPQVGDDRAVLHHVDAVGELEHLVEPVRDEDEGGAAPSGADAVEQDLDLGPLEHRGRLVEQDDEMAGGCPRASAPWRARPSAGWRSRDRRAARARIDVELTLASWRAAAA